MTLEFFMHRFEASKNVLIELLAVYYTLTCISSFFFYRNCSGTRQWKRRQFIENDPPFLIISVSYPSQCGLELGDVPEDVTVLGKR